MIQIIDDGENDGEEKKDSTREAYISRIANRKA
jgi:hypothetical protein